MSEEEEVEEPTMSRSDSGSGGEDSGTVRLDPAAGTHSAVPTHSTHMGMDPTVSALLATVNNMNERDERADLRRVNERKEDRKAAKERELRQAIPSLKHMRDSADVVEFIDLFEGNMAAGCRMLVSCWVLKGLACSRVLPAGCKG